jgi:hypothetical protein
MRPRNSETLIVRGSAVTYDVIPQIEKFTGLQTVAQLQHSLPEIVTFSTEKADSAAKFVYREIFIIGNTFQNFRSQQRFEGGERGRIGIACIVYGVEFFDVSHK